LTFFSLASDINFSICLITSSVLDLSALILYAPQTNGLPDEVINTTPHKCSCFTFVQPSNVAVTPSGSFLAILIIFSCKVSELFFKTFSAITFRFGSLIPGAIN
jgi:hypothetical protein